MPIARPSGTGGATGAPEQHAPLTRDLIVAQVRDAGDRLVLDLLGTGANASEFAAAIAWFNDDAAARGEGAVPPVGRAGEVLELLRQAEETDAPGATDDP